MGCVSTRERLGKEEQAIMLMENQLEYFKNNSAFVDGIIRKYTTDGIVNQSQWEDICISLEIKTKNTSMCPLTEGFYRKFLDNGVYNAQDLGILGILLSNGLARQKARLLFEIYDKTCTGLIYKEDLEKILEKITWISIRLLPKLVDNSTNPPISSVKTRDYAKKLLGRVEVANNNLLNHILGQDESIALEKFSLIFDNDENGQVLTPHGFRNYVNEQITLI